MCNAVHKQHVFTCCGSVAEPVAEVEAERPPVVKVRLQTTPVPGVFICPYAATPVQRAKACAWVKLVPFALHRAVAACAHAVYFCVVVKCVRFIERCCNCHLILREVCQCQLAFKWRAVQEFVKPAFQHSLVVAFLEAHLYALVGVVHVALFGTTRQSQFAERQPFHYACRLECRLGEVKKTCRNKRHVTVVGNGQRNGFLSVGYDVVVPFFYAPRMPLDVAAVVVSHRACRVACLRQSSVCQQFAFGKFCLHILSFFIKIFQ